jgi:hypothetical protein
MITKIPTPEGREKLFEKEIVVPVRKQKFTVKMLDMQIEALEARINTLKKDKADALALTEGEK